MKVQIIRLDPKIVANISQKYEVKAENSEVR